MSTVSETLTVDIVRAAAGRDLDVLVAEHVMGWRPAPTPPVEIAWARSAGVGTRPGPWWVAAGLDPICAVLEMDLPFYSASWAGAGLVVEELRRRGWYEYLEPYGPTGRHWSFRKVVAKEEGFPDQYRGDCRGDDQAVSCCRAALLAIIAEATR